MNYVTLVGRLVATPEIKKTESDKKYTYITLAVTRNYKNAEGIYETDFIPCLLWEPIATHTIEYCLKGDIVGVKGRLQTKTIENENGEKIQKLEVVGEKVTFLASKKGNEEE